MKLFTNVRVLILIAFIVFSIVAINPRPWQDGATIRSIDKDSASSVAGMQPSDPKTSPVLRERIIAVDSVPVHSAVDFARMVSKVVVNQSLRIETNKQVYVVTVVPNRNVTVLPEIETIIQTNEVYNETTLSFENVTTNVTQNKTIVTLYGIAPLGITVYDAPKTNIRLGLDLSGGARVLLEPEEQVDQQTLDTIIETIKQRLNVFGLSDVVVRPVRDLSGHNFILVEIAGATERDVRDLVLRQGKFEAKIANQTVMRGGTDITYVCRSPDCSGIAQRGCTQAGDGNWGCQFQFTLTMTPAAAEKQANVTRALPIVTQTDGQQYLSQKLDLYLDDKLVDSLLIGASLRGQSATQISISGPGTGVTQRAAMEDALYSMKQLQTVLITGSLPVKLRIVKTDTISAELGDEFIRNSLFVGLLAFLAVTLTMGIRYRNPRVSIPVIVTLLSEVIIILGAAAVLGWNMDLAAIAGIIIAIGTGVDAQIVIADETLSGESRGSEADWKDKMKKAFFIIFTTYFTALAAMIPLLFAGAGLVKGFALTSMIGVTIGALITRPAFAAIMERLEEGRAKKKH